MPGHEKFEQLCALAASGQIPAEEWHDLRDHLQSCLECAQLLGDFGKVGADLIEDFATALPAGYFADLRSQFVQRAQQHGRMSSAPVWGFPWRAARKLQAALLLGCAACIGIFLFGKSYVQNRPDVPAHKTAASVNVATPMVQAEAAPTSRHIDSQDVESANGSTAVAAALQVQALEQDGEALRHKLNLVTDHETQLQSQIDLLNAQLATKNDDLNSARSGQQSASEQAMHAQGLLDKSESHNIEQEIRVASLQTQIKDIENKLLYEDADLEREKALNAVGKNGQSIMAARNLHIVDVYDADGHGARRSFGRVFYVEGQELIFYAYDLSDSRHANAQFVAWGAGQKPEQSVTRLGILHYDGQNEQRWTLRYTDPKVLSTLDSIFVSAETTTTPEKPNGRRLLFAVLTGQANHP